MSEWEYNQIIVPTVDDLVIMTKLLSESGWELTHSSGPVEDPERGKVWIGYYRRKSKDAGSSDEPLPTPPGRPVQA